MLTMSYGQLPDKSVIESRIEGDAYNFSFRLGTNDANAMIEAINQGIDSHLEAVFFEQSETGGRLSLEIEKRSMHTLIRRLTEAWENGSEVAGDLVSGILSTLDIEWI